MESRALRELQQVHHVANAFLHLERTIELWSQLSVVGDVEGRGWLVDEAELNPLADLERDVHVVLVVEELVALLCLL
jgi:hypothetical protein